MVVYKNVLGKYTEHAACDLLSDGSGKIGTCVCVSIRDCGCVYLGGHVCMRACVYMCVRVHARVCGGCVCVERAGKGER